MAFLVAACGTRQIQGRPAPEHIPDEPICAAEEAQAASVALLGIDEEVAKAASDEDAAAVVERLKRLDKSPCFSVLAVAGGIVPDPEVLSGDELRDYWASGGKRWAFQVFTPRFERDRVVYFRPGFRPRRSWYTRGHPLTWLTCTRPYVQCDQTASAWVGGAEAAYRAGSGDWEGPRPLSVSSPAECGTFAMQFDKSKQLAAWLECADRTRPRVRTLPRGTSRSPTTGTFVVFADGRGGCVELRAYSLETGRAVVVRARGTVTQASTRLVPRDLLRRAVWATLVAPEALPLPATTEIEIPPDVPVSRNRVEPFTWVVGFASSGSLKHLWAYAHRGRTAFGQADVGGSRNAAMAYAEQCFEAAETAASESSQAVPERAIPAVSLCEELASQVEWAQYVPQIRRLAEVARSVTGGPEVAGQSSLPRWLKVHELCEGF